jgi:transcriptional regulator with XRE-family HTH domain
LVKKIIPLIMDTKKDLLVRAVHSIKTSAEVKGKNITEEEMAGKMGISLGQLQAYLHGEDEIPDDLLSRLKTASGVRTMMVRSTQTVEVHDRKMPGNEQEQAEENRKSLKAIILLIRKSGESRGMKITEEEMARKMDISGEQLQAYLNGEAGTPDNQSQLLLTAYEDLLTSIRQENNRESLSRSIVLIRNRGLAEGMDITLEEMALKAGISGEQLYAYLNGEGPMPDDLFYVLESAYEDLLKDFGKVEIRENLYLDKNVRRVKLL